MNTSSTASGRPFNDVRAARIAAGAALGILVAVPVGANVYLDHQKPLYARFTGTYARCLTGTAWDPRTTASEQRIDLPHLTVYGSGGSSQLVFTARTNRGSDRIRPVDSFTAQVLSQHQCPDDIVPAGR